MHIYIYIHIHDSKQNSIFKVKTTQPQPLSAQHGLTHWLLEDVVVILKVQERS